MDVQGKVSLDSLTRYVHHHSDIRFSFNSRKIKGDRLIVFSKGSYDLKALLQHIKRGTGLYFFVYGRHVIFQDEPRKTAIRTSPSGTPPSEGRPQPLLAVKPARHPSTVVPRPSAFVTQHPSASVRQPSLIVRPPFSNVHSSSPQSPFTHPPVAPRPARVRDKRPNYSRAADKAANTSTRGPSTSIDWHLQTGFFASEVMYVNPAIEAGIKPIHLLLSYGSNFHVQGWRIGLGSVIADNPNRQWQLMATYSPLQHSQVIDSGAHPINFTIKGQLYSAEIAWCKHIDPHWLFKVSASLNFLHSTYYKDGVPTAPLSFFSSTENPDTKAWLVRPPWMLRNTFDAHTTSNNKVWVGLSVGIYFDLKFF
jgi:hypothetical protein